MAHETCLLEFVGKIGSELNTKKRLSAFFNGSLNLFLISHGTLKQKEVCRPYVVSATNQKNIVGKSTFCNLQNDQALNYLNVLLI